ncbi:23S rRNA (uracil-5-)-methyltransferase RumB, partial [Yersinia pestis PY-36]
MHCAQYTAGGCR